jgi:hypothetical protein
MCICSLFNDAVSSSDYTAVKNKSRKICKEAAKIKFKLMSQNFHGGELKIHDKSQSGQSVIRLNFETGIT